MQPLQASPLVSTILDAATREQMAGMRIIMQREADFPSRLQAQLTGVALDPIGREMANRLIDTEFQTNRLYRELPKTTIPELIIGSGFHAATYVATRTLMGKPVPYVFEREDHAGGAFAIRSADGTYPGVFNLNSRNRRGNPGLSGDTEAQLNYLPGAPIQASALSNVEYQTNADMAFIVRATLAQYAPDRVFPGHVVQGIERAADAFDVTYSVGGGSSRTIRAQRIIDARGLGDARLSEMADGATVLTFAQFMQRMSGLWPLRGLRNVAVIGGGDSGRCAVESLLGLGPSSLMSTVELDSVNRVDWYARGVASNYEDYCATNRGRYRAIGRYLRPDKMGFQRLNVFGARSAFPTTLPGGPALVDGRSYDLVVLAAGNEVETVDGLDWDYSLNVYSTGSRSRIVAKVNEYDNEPARRFRIGPRANIEFDNSEIDAGVAAIDNNRVAMFRLSTRTAALAVQLD